MYENLNSDADEFVAAVNSASHTASAPRIPQELMPTPQGNSSDWMKNLTAASCWAQSGNTYFPVSDVVQTIPAGAYRCGISNTGPYIEKMKIQTDNLLALPDSSTEILLKEFSQFWTLKKAFDKRGFTFKRGMLMWGPPGCLAADTEIKYSTRGPDGKKRSGKTSTIERLYQAFHRIPGKGKGRYQIAPADSNGSSLQ